MMLLAPRTPLVAVRRPAPSPGPGEVLLEVAACGVCRTDLHLVDGELPAVPLPVVPGHEVVGRVALLGAGASRFRSGERVGVPWLAGACGHCRHCASGNENLCDEAVFTGYHRDGGYARYAVADERFCLALPDAYDDAHAAPLLCAGLIGYRAYAMAPGPRGWGSTVRRRRAPHRAGGRGRGPRGLRLHPSRRRALAGLRPRTWLRVGGGSDEAAPAALDAPSSSRRSEASCRRRSPVAHEGRHRRLRRHPHERHPVVSVPAALGSALCARGELTARMARRFMASPPHPVDARPVPYALEKPTRRWRTAARSVRRRCRPHNDIGPRAVSDNPSRTPLATKHRTPQADGASDVAAVAGRRPTPSPGKPSSSRCGLQGAGTACAYPQPSRGCTPSARFRRAAARAPRREPRSASANSLAAIRRPGAPGPRHPPALPTPAVRVANRAVGGTSELSMPAPGTRDDRDVAGVRSRLRNACSVSSRTASRPFACRPPRGRCAAIRRRKRNGPWSSLRARASISSPCRVETRASRTRRVEIDQRPRRRAHPRGVWVRIGSPFPFPCRRHESKPRLRHSRNIRGHHRLRVPPDACTSSRWTR